MDGNKTRYYKSRPGMNKKGLIFTDLFILIAIAIVVIIIFAGFIIFFNLINNNVRDIGVIDGVGDTKINMTELSDNTLGYVTLGVDGLRLIALMMFVGFMISIFITGFFSRYNKFIFILYIFIALIAIIFSIVISNAYQDTLRTDSFLGETLQSFTAIDYILVYFPFVITVIAFVAGILMFIGMNRDPDSGGGI